MKRIKISTIIVSLLFCITAFSIVVHADDSTTRTIIGDYFNKVFDIELTDGRGLTETNEDIKEREKINTSIYDGSINKNYSLYDRFGGNIRFIPYFGETKISSGLLDRFYTKFVDNDAEFELSVDDIKKLFASPAISNNVVYKDRPNILSTDSIEAGNIDPRVYAYSGISSTGGDAALGNAMLQLSIMFTTTIGWLSGSGLFNTINDIWTATCNAGLNDIMKNLIYLFLPLSMCAFVLSMVSKSFKVMKGKDTFRNILSQLLSVGLSLGIIFTLMANPTTFSNVLTKIATQMDGALDSAIQIDANEVVKSSNVKNVRISTLWNKTVFEPWCYGMFGSNYEKLYTQYDKNSSHEKMPQSHDDVKTAWTNGTVKYNSKDLTGDVKVQIGKNKFVQNWAALAWSTQSIYHLDAVKDKESEDNDKINETKENDSVKAWPKATTTPMNDQIYVDNFRWLDAKLNISPEYSAADKVIMNYTNSRPYEQNFISAGVKSIYMSLLLLPILILSLRKLVNSLKIVSTSFSLIYKSVVNMVMPERYNILTNLQGIVRPLYDFFWWSMIIFLATTTYSKIAGHSVIADCVWLFIGIYLCKFKPIRTPRQLRAFLETTKKKASQVSSNMVNWTERKLNKNISK